MPNYKESSITGATWQRAYQVIVNNKFGTTPSVIFNEEEIIDIGNGTMSKHIGHIAEMFTDPNVEFNLINPLDGSVIGTTTYQNIYIILSSLYQHLADKRDNPPAV